jgi:NADP-dependent 3-hydroxy acid dehydrogenase YdfG
MPSQRNPLSTQVLVITGATSCIGLATARMAARQGATLVIAASNVTTLERLASEIRQAGGQVVAFPVDVAIKEQVAALGRMAMQRFGRIDTWINAGMAMDDREGLQPAPVAERLFKAHYWGVAYGASVALDLMKKAGGTIINLDSAASARHGVKGYTDVLRAEIETEGVPVSMTLIHAASTSRNDMRNAPQQVAEAILHAAQHMQRDMLVRGALPAPASRASLVPRLLEKCMDFLGLRHLGATSGPGNPRPFP